jgi:hypothetical protein
MSPSRGERKLVSQVVALSIASEVCDLRATKTTLAVVGNVAVDSRLCSGYWESTVDRRGDWRLGVDRRGDWRLGVPACGADGARMAWHLSEIYQVGRQHPWLERSPLPPAPGSRAQEASTHTWSCQYYTVPQYQASPASETPSLLRCTLQTFMMCLRPWGTSSFNTQVRGSCPMVA